ncbi:Uncharacterised protein [Klebsiella pneumoniae]|uniref:Uncharacterized protein n=1 Tax=Klebsiella pneumoniae TaxID=573 RepID=A0A378P3B7_KLEPN|nr:Uncharacterised protein [Klebsiella pneumoniae]
MQILLAQQAPGRLQPVLLQQAEYAGAKQLAEPLCEFAGVQPGALSQLIQARRLLHLRQQDFARQLQARHIACGQVHAGRRCDGAAAPALVQAMRRQLVGPGTEPQPALRLVQRAGKQLPGLADQRCRRRQRHQLRMPPPIETGRQADIVLLQPGDGELQQSVIERFAGLEQVVQHEVVSPGGQQQRRAVQLHLRPRSAFTAQTPATDHHDLQARAVGFIHLDIDIGG